CDRLHGWAAPWRATWQRPQTKTTRQRPQTRTAWRLILRISTRASVPRSGVPRPGRTADLRLTGSRPGAPGPPQGTGQCLRRRTGPDPTRPRPSRRLSPPAAGGAATVPAPSPATAPPGSAPAASVPAASAPPASAPPASAQPVSPQVREVFFGEREETVCQPGEREFMLENLRDLQVCIVWAGLSG